MVAGLQALHARADFANDACAFMAEDDREQAFRVRAGAREFVRVADASGHDFHQHFAGAGTLEVHLDDLERLVGSKRDGSAGFHGSKPW